MKTIRETERGSPFRGDQRYGPRLVQVLPEQHSAMTGVQAGHLDLIGIRVGPVQFAAEPVHRQAVGGNNAPRNDCHLWEWGLGLPGE